MEDIGPKEAKKNIRKRVGALVVIFLISNIITGYVVDMLASMDYESRIFWNYTIVPDVELEGVMLFYGHQYQGEVLESPVAGQLAYGDVTGFVAFDNISDQPKSARQYQTVVATDRFDDRGIQIFEVYDIYKLQSLPPKSLGDPTEFFYQDHDDSSITLSDGNGWVIMIEKGRNAKISSRDAQGDRSYLITNELEFRDFMELLHSR